MTLGRGPSLLAAALIVAGGLATPSTVDAQPAPSDVTVGTPGAGLWLTVFSATYLRSPSATSVLVGVEIQGLASATETPAGGGGRLELRLRDGDSPAAAEHAVDVSLADGGTAARASLNGLRILARMALAPGRHALRVVARDTRDGTTASVVHNLDVPTLVDAPITMSHLVFSSSTVGGVTHAEVEEDGMLPIVGRPPTGRRQFRRTERVEVNAEIYDAITNVGADDDFDALSVATMVLSPDGRVVYETSDAGASEPLESGVYGYRHYALVPVDTLAPGPYVVRVAALLNGSVIAARSVPITVVASN